MKKISFYNLILEVTRRCNFKCEHCARGAAQDLDMSDMVMEAVLRHTDRISSVTFSGGEPGLAVDRLRTFMELAALNTVEVGNFYIATNGSVATDEYLRALIDLYLLCDENESTAVEISSGDFHDSQRHKTDEAAMEKLKVLRFVQDRHETKGDNIISEGRGIRWNKLNGHKGREETDGCLEIEETDDKYTVAEMFYVNAKGDVLAGCDYSYESQEKRKKGNVLAEPLLEIIARLYAEQEKRKAEEKVEWEKRMNTNAEAS